VENRVPLFCPSGFWKKSSEQSSAPEIEGSADQGLLTLAGQGAEQKNPQTGRDSIRCVARDASERGAVIARE
jgi:hypothetical protein